MLTNKEDDFYLSSGKLDLSILNEVVRPAIVKNTRTIFEEIDSMKPGGDISSTLEEVALMFEEEDQIKEAFNQERLEEEMKEFEEMD